MGGNGKTPTVINIQKRLIALGYNVHVVTRGYLGYVKGPYKVNQLKDNFKKVGDEALLISKNGTTWVSKKKYKGIRKAYLKGADLILLDDGFQNFSIEKSISIVVVDALNNFGNNLLFPAGPLREPIKKGITRSDIILLVGTKEDIEKTKISYPILNSRNIFSAQIMPSKDNLCIKNKNYIAFAGIAKPTKFFKSLKDFNYRIISEYSLPNHKPLKENFLKKINNEAKRLNAKIITTEKDYERVPYKYKDIIEVFKIEMKISKDNELIDYLIKKLKI